MMTISARDERCGFICLIRFGNGIQHRTNGRAAVQSCMKCRARSPAGSISDDDDRSHDHSIRHFKAWTIATGNSNGPRWSFLRRRHSLCKLQEARWWISLGPALKAKSASRVIIGIVAYNMPRRSAATYSSRDNRAGGRGRTCVR